MIDIGPKIYTAIPQQACGLKVKVTNLELLG